MCNLPHSSARRSIGRGAAVLLTSLALASLPHTSEALIVTMVNSNTNPPPGGETWNTPGDWSNNAAPTSDNDYQVGAGFTVRSPAGNAVFGGNSLTISGGFNLQSGSTDDVLNNAEIADLTINNGGSIQVVSGGNVTGTNLSFSGAVIINTSNSNSRRRVSLEYNSFSGSGSILFDGRGFLTLNNTSTSYTGDWSIGGVNSNSTTQPGTVIAATAGSLGSGDITVNNNGRIDIGYDYFSSIATLTLAAPTTQAVGTIFLTNNLTFGAVDIGGTFLDPGTYTFAELDSAFDAYFVAGGTGTITVVPEPANLVMFGLAAGAAMLRRKRR